MIKVGQTVVFIGVLPGSPAEINCPKIGEHVIVDAIFTQSQIGYVLRGYETCKLGFSQWFESAEIQLLKPSGNLNTAAIARELVLTPERLDAPTPAQKPVHEPQSA